MLTIQNADKWFRKHKKNSIHVIHHTSLELGDNGLVALLGPSGCGKTTLLNTIGGLDKLGSGSIYVNHQKISSKFMYKVDKIRNLNIGYIFQDYKLIDQLSVYDNVAISLQMLGIKDKQEIKEKVEYVLDCVGMLRYKKRPANMLSGGERQRVGIARALVKDPSIILADEPTGNLDSKNTLEIMKIIKSISEKRLVILVTHEQNLAKFYATRIVEIEDGMIKKDYINKNVDDLDYEMESNFYLNDFRNQVILRDDKVDVHLYRDEIEKVDLDIVVKNGNIYIKSKTKKKVEVVDEDSSIDFVHGSYEKIRHNQNEQYQFDFARIESCQKKKYASIIHLFSSLFNGFKKVLDYSLLKKMLLIGFFFSGMFVMYSVSSYVASLKFDERDFIEVHRDYLTVTKEKLNLNEYLDLEKDDSFIYLLPGTSKLKIQVPLKDYYQTSNVNLEMDVSLASNRLLKESDLIYGNLPLQDKEVVIDYLVFENATEVDNSYQMAGIVEVKDILYRDIIIGNRTYKVVGISNTYNPCLYVSEKEFVPILSTDSSLFEKNSATASTIFNYDDVSSQLELKKGRVPVNDYEVIVPIDKEELMPLGKEIDVKVGDKKLVVVGYYTSQYQLYDMYTNVNTIKYLVILQNRSFTVMPNSGEKDIVFEKFQQGGYHVSDTYVDAMNQYLEIRKDSVHTTFVISRIILLISFVEIFLMIRASFLSRIKEVGIYRAIGVKKSDICKMFTGEIFAITTMGSIPGLLFMTYILSVLSSIKYLKAYIWIDFNVILISVIMIYGFNLIIGLLPVLTTIRKRPAEILSRSDVD